MTPSAEKQIKALLGLQVGSWLLTDYIDGGKSALVFKGSRGKDIAAVKVFDSELLEKYGKEDQLSRIERQVTLVGKHHPNLINIIEGGLCEATGLYYLVMDYFDGPSLAKVVTDIPLDRIWPIIGQIADAAYFLEGLDLVHRDIKPDNIGITPDFQKAVLLDLGVVRPMADPGLTDTEQKRFLGTLRYSSPEFLFRREEQNVEGWRALTFYQLGAVLHDMLMRTPIFEEYTEPYARLVEAVRSENPKIVAPGASPDLILLAQHCLLKDPKLRARLVHWEDFQPKSTIIPASAAAKERIRKRVAAKRSIEAKLEESVLTEHEARNARRVMNECHSVVEQILRQECIGTGLFPPIELRQYSESTPNKARTVLSFPPSATFALSHRLTIWILLELKDSASRIVTVHATSDYSDTHPADVGKMPPTSVVYEGIFDEAVVRGRLIEYLYGTLDKAQQ